MRKASPAPAVQSVLQLDGVYNARDLGGLIGAQGKRVRSGKLFRSGNPAHASSADIQRLEELGLDAVIDFRCAPEKSQDDGTFARHFNWIPMPVLDGNIQVDSLLPKLRHATPDFSTAMMTDVYRSFPTRYQEPFAAFLKQAATGQTLLFHCTAGKDRTGFAAMLLLSALGVSWPDILSDYLTSNRLNSRLFQDVLPKSFANGIPTEVMMPLLEVSPAYLETAGLAIEAACGGMEPYLRDVMGVDLDALRGHYLES